MCFCAMRRIGAGMVAENSAICRSGGVCSQDPLDGIDESHLQHLVGFIEHDEASGPSSFSVPRLMWSMTRPGVPTITCTPRLNAFSCG